MLVVMLRSQENSIMVMIRRIKKGWCEEGTQLRIR